MTWDEVVERYERTSRVGRYVHICIDSGRTWACIYGPDASHLGTYRFTRDDLVKVRDELLELFPLETEGKP